jgi:predicted enzyme related to lactoylglutathione lyase
VPLELRNVTFTSSDPGRLADFWAGALGYTERRDGEEEVLLAPPDWGFPRFSFQRGRRGPVVDDDPVHLDLTTADMEAEVARLLPLGATVLWTIRAQQSGTTTWTTMRDPDGNRFCVVQRPPGD